MKKPQHRSDRSPSPTIDRAAVDHTTLDRATGGRQPDDDGCIPRPWREQKKAE